MKSRINVREPEQTDRPAQEKQGARQNCQQRDSVLPRHLDFLKPESGSLGQRRTNTTVDIDARIADTRATSRKVGLDMPSESNSKMAVPVVVNNCVANIRSAAVGPRQIRSMPTNTLSNKNEAKAIIHSLTRPPPL